MKAFESYTIEFPRTETLAEVFGISMDDCERTMKDGRGASPWIEAKLGVWLGLARNPDINGTFDLWDEELGDRYEVRTLTKNGVNFVPSCCIGSGRRIDATKVEKKFENTHAFIVADVTEYPKVHVYLIYAIEIISRIKSGSIPKGGLSLRKFNERIELS